MSDERGQVTPLVVGMTVALLLCAGLVVDGGRVFAARREASDVAGQAARAGAQVISLDGLRGANTSALDPAGSRAAARGYLSSAGHDGVVTVEGDAVTVTVRITTPLAILGLGGLAERTVTGTETARSVRGVAGAET